MASGEAAAAKIAIITTLGCPYCEKAKSALITAQIPHQIVDLTDQPQLLSTIKQQTGQVTVPQIFIGGTLLGGASDLLEAMQSGKLAQLLQETTSPPLPQSIATAIVSLQQNTASPQTAVSEELNLAVEAFYTKLRASPLIQQSSDCSFTLKDAVQWMEQQEETTTDGALKMLTDLQAAQLLTINQTTNDISIDGNLLQRAPNTLLCCVEDIPLPNQLKTPLNSHFQWYGQARSATVVSAELRRFMLQLFSTHLTPDGRLVDYVAMVKDPAFRKFVDATAELQKVSIDELTREEALCFWINTYNALILHATAIIGPATSTLSRLQWFDSISYTIGGYRFTSNDIEHGVLRGNAPSPAAFFSLLGKSEWAGPTFKSRDARSALSIRPVDPRIHFALNCGAMSCPPIKVYTPDRVEVGLEAAAQAFCTSEIQLEEREMTLTTSMIFKWYGKDFGDKEALLKFMVAHLPQERKKVLERMLLKAGAAGIEMNYRPYDWGTNAK